MSEYTRVSIPNKDNVDIYQIVDEELCMILNKATGNNMKFGSDDSVIGTIEDALKVLEKDPYKTRWIIAKLSCIVSHKIEK